MSKNGSVSFAVQTSLQPGAIAIIQLTGSPTALDQALFDITRRDKISPGSLHLVPFADIDEGVVVRLNPTTAFLMPHGGPRIRQRMVEHLFRLGLKPDAPDIADSAAIYPEASNLIEARMLDALARAASPLAIDLLLDQPRRWEMQGDTPLSEDDLTRSRHLNHLLDPPTVVVAGPPNVGKSSLANALLGRTMSIALDQPGVTRDYTHGAINLAGLVVSWHDTPGFPSRVGTAHHSPDNRRPDASIESRALALVEKLISRADYLILLTDPQNPWPPLPDSVSPDLRIVNKSDLPDAQNSHPEADLRVSAETGTGLPRLVQRIRDDLLPPADLNHSGPWKFWEE